MFKKDVGDLSNLNKIRRNSEESLLIKLSQDEIKYRNRFLPDATNLSDEKLVCSVCTIPLSQSVRTGDDIYVHRTLEVLMCKRCYNFYGDGCFSADEDGVDKYCRWCGQGGILYICCECTVVFCELCLNKNLKLSALTRLERDDWKCLICYPRPIFGPRTICWAAQELNKIGKKKKKSKLKKQEDVLKRMKEAKEKKEEERRIKEKLIFEDLSPKKRKRQNKDSDSSSVEIPPKRSKHKRIKTRGLNGFTKRKLSRNKTEMNSENETSEDDSNSSSKNRYHEPSSSDSEDDFVISSDESSDDIQESSKKQFSTDSDSSHRKHKKKTKSTKKRRTIYTSESYGSDFSEKEKSKRFRKRKRISSSNESLKNKKREKGSPNESSRDLSDNELNTSTETKEGIKNPSIKCSTKYLEDNHLNEANKKFNCDTESSSSVTNNQSNEQQHSKKLENGDLNKKKEKQEISKVHELEVVNEGLSEKLDISKTDEISQEKHAHQAHSPNDEKHDLQTQSLHDEKRDLQTQSVHDKKHDLQTQSVHDEKHDDQTQCHHDKKDDHQTDCQRGEKDDQVDQKNDQQLMKLDESESPHPPENLPVAEGNVEENIKLAKTWFGEKDDQVDQRNDQQSMKLDESESPHPPENLPVAEGNIEENIKLAKTWLDSIVNDMSDLGNLIKEHTNKFANKKIYNNSLDSYEDVLDTANKLKRLISGVQENYTLIETGLQNNFQPWKILVGLEDLPSCEKSDEEKTEEKEHITCVSRDEDVANFDETAENEGNEPIKILDKNGSCEYEGDLHDSPEKLSNNNECISEGPKIAGKEVEMDKLTHNKLENPLVAIHKDLDQAKMVDNSHESLINNGVNKLTSLLGHNNVYLDEEKVKETLRDPSDTFEQDQDFNKSGDFLEQTIPDENVDDKDLSLNKPNANNESCLISNRDGSIVSEVKTKENEISVEKKNELKDPNDNKSDNLDLFCDKVENVSGNEKENELADVKGSSSPSKEDEALQLMLCPSSEEDIKSSESESDDSSSDIHLSDSDLDITKLSKVITKKIVRTKRKENNKLESEVEPGEEKEAVTKKESKEDEQKQIDSETEINMLTDLTKLKKKTSRKFLSVESSEEGSEKESDEDDDDHDHDHDHKEESRKQRKCLNESRKRREDERNELFGFLKENSGSDDECDITKKDLDGIEDQYASSSSDSMSLETFRKNMNEKWKELEQEQEEMNLKLLLASDSEEGSVGGDDIVLDPNLDKKKKKDVNKKINEEKEEEVSADQENKIETQIEAKEEKSDVIDEENLDEAIDKTNLDMSKHQRKFKGLGSSSEQSEQDNEIEIKEEVLSDELKIKKEANDSDLHQDSSDSNSSGDMFLDKGKKKSMKKKSWRNNKLLRIKLSDTDTSDEEQWWQRRLEKKKKESGDSDSSVFDEFAQGLTRRKKSVSPVQNTDSGSDKENKKQRRQKKVIDESGSSTCELSSTESSGSCGFKKKKKKRKAGTSDSDVVILSEDDGKTKKTKKKRRGDDSSDESNDSDGDVIELSQKSSLGESPGKGGRKNIRKVLTKNELAAATKAAAKEEEERKKRIAARQKLFNEVFEIEEAEALQKLVLDFDPDTKTELLSVDQDLVVKMKPHQAKGVKFMWDSCFESLSQLKTKKGSGCILAHCMGLGKTFQVISLVHTILKHKDTHVKTVLVVCPLSTVLNWAGEFRKWLDDVAGGRSIRIYHLTKCRRPHERARELTTWNQFGGVMIMGYEMFRNLSNESTKKFRLHHKEIFQKTLIDPGADLVVCDEGHMLKNESTLLSKAMSRIKSLRRIVLTGTPMQNNLKEYHCMVQFVKPNLLGTRKEFLNQFVNPITNGQFVDSTESDVKVMKRRAHVLHKMLEGLVQRFDYSVLTPFLPPKHEYVISLRLSDVQVKLYQFYLDHFSQGSNHTRTGSQLFTDWQALGRIWTHPLVLKMSTDKAEKEREKKKLEESEEEGSMKRFIDDKSSLSLSSSHSSSSSLSSDDDNDKQENKNKKEEEKLVNKTTLSLDVIDTAINLISSDEEEPVKGVEMNDHKDDLTETEQVNHNGSEENKIGLEQEENKDEEASKEIEKRLDEFEGEKEHGDVEEKNNKNGKGCEQHKKESKKDELDSKSAWWKPLIEPKHLEDLNLSAKLILLFAILHECQLIEDKVLVFSQSLFTLDLIELFLQKIDEATEENRLEESLGNHAGCWTKGLDYFRLDGSTSSENRSAWCKSFNKEDNSRARLFLISTRAGGLGINLTAANRVIIFDASWNPSHDVQSIFRIYRFGQKKPCYVYRFIASGTMEEKVYDRQVAKQSLSSRVVDEQQVHRHFSMNDLNELYTFTPPGPKVEKPTPVLPKDRLMAELLTQYSDWIEKYHEHDSLLENVVEEELNEEERKLAWEDFENDKKKAVFPTPGTSGAFNFSSNPAVSAQVEYFRKSLKMKYPNASEQELQTMLQTLVYQVTYMNMKNSQQFSSKQPQQPQAQAGARTSQAGPSNNNLTPQQKFSLQRNNLYKKFGSENQTTSNEMIGNGQIKRQNQIVGNGQPAAVAQTTNKNQTLGNMPVIAPAGTYEDLMRQQQQANLERVRNQGLIQQTMSKNTNSASSMLNKVYKPNLNRITLPVQNTQQQIQSQKHTVPNLQQTLKNRQQINKNQQTQNSGMVGNRQVRRNLNSTQQPATSSTISNQTLGGKQAPQAPSVNNNRSPRLRNLQTISNRILPRPQKTQQQLMQEQMRKRISDLQHQKHLSLQQSMRKTQLSPLENHKRELEEMKKRYKASRNQTSNTKDIPVVDIDDDKPSDPPT